MTSEICLPDGTPVQDSGHVQDATFPRCRAGASIEAASNGLAEDLLELGLELPSVYLLAGGRLRCHAARGYFQVVDGFSPGTGVIGTVVASGRTELIEDVRTRPDFIAAIPGLRAEVCAAIRVGGEIVGALSIESRSTLPDGADVLAEAAAEVLGRRLEELGGLPTPSLSQRLGQTAVALTRAGSTVELEQQVVAAAVELSGMPSAALVHLGPIGAVLTAVTGPLGARLRAWGHVELGELASWVSSGTSSHFPGGGADLPAEHLFLREAGIRSLSVHPMVVGGVITGVLVLASDQPSTYAPAVVDCLELLAAHTAALSGLVTALGEVSRRADLDELTGLPNRSCFARSVGAALGRLHSARESVAVLLLDLDDFKHVNDSLGHHAGDRLLCEVSRRLRATLRSDDTVCRLGGDEFAIVLPHSSAAAAQATAERLLDALAEVYALDGALLETSASIGITLSGSVTDAPEQLLRAADLAMYLAKQRGKGRCAQFEPHMQLAALDRLALESDLRKVVHDGGLSLAYQPIVSLVTGALAGVEALVRWTDPVRGPVSPVEFIPVAEESGLVVPLGAWVLKAACAQLASWLQAGADLTMSVNVSTRQLERSGLLEAVDECLAAGLEPGRLVLEITETALTGDAAVAAETLLALRERGVQVAVDDFGTGYSSLDRLRTAPIDRLKVDRSFIAEIHHLDDSAPVVDATLMLSRGFGLDAVAEGVETTVQLAYLTKAGCAYAQGFLLSRPLPAEQVPVLSGDVLPWAALFPAAPGEHVLEQTRRTGLPAHHECPACDRSRAAGP